MKNIVDRYLNIFRKERQARRKRICVLSALALVIILGVFWQLRLMGITTSGEEISMSEETIRTEESDENDADEEDIDDEELNLDFSNTEEDENGSDSENESIAAIEADEGEGNDDSENDVEEEVNQEGEADSENEDLSDDEDSLEVENPSEEESNAGLSESSDDSAGVADFTDEDLETASDWEATLPELTGVWSEDVVAVARSQVGYTEKEITTVSIEEIEETGGAGETEVSGESEGAGETEAIGESEGTGETEVSGESEGTGETEVTGEAEEAGETEITGESEDAEEIEVTGKIEVTRTTVVVEEYKYGYTRYGAWYGDEYGDWNTVFALFCLYYASVPEEEFPRSSDVSAWSAVLSGVGLYKEAEGCIPSAGDLVFLDSDADGQADRVGIVSGVTEETITVIEGDSNNAVEEKSYTLSDSSILSYGSMPEQVVTELTVYESLLAQINELNAQLQEVDEQTDDEEIQKIYANLTEILNEADLALTEGTLTEEEHEALYEAANYLTLTIKEFVQSITVMAGAVENLPEECISYNFYEVSDTDYETPVSITNALYYKLKIDITGYTTDENGDTVVLLYANRTYVYDLDLPDGIDITIDGELTAGNSSVVVGTWDITNNTLTISTNSTFNQYSEFSGYIKVMVANTHAEEEINASITKEDGVYDAENRAIDWTITLSIPAHRSDDDYSTYYVTDYSDYSGNMNWTDLIASDNSFSVVLYSAEYDSEVELKSVEDVGEGDTVAYYADGTRLYFVNKCQCDSSTCQNFGDDVCGNLLDDNNEWCTCWNSSYNVTVVICYSESISDEDLASTVSTGSESPIINLAYLYVNNVRTASSSAKAEIPVLIGKKMDSSGMSSLNDYSVDFTVTVNESGVDFSARSYLEVVDTLSNLQYTSGSMEIYKLGDETTLLTEGVDYTLEVGDPDEDNLKQTLTIIIYNPGSSTYIINYSACLWSYTGTSVPFENEVSFDRISVSTYDEFEFAFTVRKYSITLNKVDLQNNTLDDAVFGLYRQNGILLKKDTTVDGQILFETNLDEGVLIESDTFYYIQEILPPGGYILDTTKHWVYFASDSDYEQTATLPDEVESWADVTVVVIDYTSDEAELELTVVNEAGAALPTTGGTGGLPYVMMGLTIIGVSAYLLLRKKSAQSA